jgi:lipopolysaccharide/colanic/teichoic acid biosynthesis glycosyltransferase
MLINSGELVLEINDNEFFKYQQGLLPASALPAYGSPGDLRSVRAAMKDSGALLLRWQSKSDSPTEWWTMVCRDTTLSHLKKKTRWTAKKNIKRGLERFKTERAHAAEIVELAYYSHVQAYSRYKNVNPLSEAEFSNLISAHSNNPLVEFWICKSNDENKVCGWCMFWLDEAGAFLHTIDIAPSGLKANAGYAMLSSCLDEYVNKRGLAVSNGTRSVSHDTAMQDFLRKLGFQREYGRLFVEYKWWLAVLVRLLMPFRLLVPRTKPFNLVRALLDQEKFSRDCKPPSKISIVFKRGFDIVLSLVGLICSSWLILICWLIASIDTRANGFFVQHRIGLNGGAFPLIKLRSMRKVDGMTSTVTAKNDKRITKFGAFLRSTKLDELPQLLNVFLGQMSFVGPRPDVEGWADQLSGDDAVILKMRPGITGPASLHFRNEEELLANAANAVDYNRDIIWPQKVEINRKYYYSQSFASDMLCLLKTIFPNK